MKLVHYESWYLFITMTRKAQCTRFSTVHTAPNEIQLWTCRLRILEDYAQGKNRLINYLLHILIYNMLTKLLLSKFWNFLLPTLRTLIIIIRNIIWDQQFPAKSIPFVRIDNYIDFKSKSFFLLIFDFLASLILYPYSVL